MASALEKIRNRIAVVLTVVVGVGASGCGEGFGNTHTGVYNGGGPPRYEILAPNSEYSARSGEPLYRVWYGTNRKPLDENDLTKGFSDLRDQLLHYGNAYVYVPISHKFGSVGSSWIVRTVTLTDDRLKVKSVEPMDEAEFMGRLRASLEKRDSGKNVKRSFISMATT